MAQFSSRPPFNDDNLGAWITITDRRADWISLGRTEAEIDHARKVLNRLVNFCDS